jgi:hypothetical protein
MAQLAAGTTQVPGANDVGAVSLQAFQYLLGNFTELKARVEENFQKDHRAAVDMSAGWLILCGEPCGCMRLVCAACVNCMRMEFRACLMPASSRKASRVRRCIGVFHADRIRHA